MKRTPTFFVTLNLQFINIPSALVLETACIIVQNFRVLHGRQSFTPSSGARHLKVAYFEWSYMTAREKFHQLSLA